MFCFDFYCVRCLLEGLRSFRDSFPLVSARFALFYAVAMSVTVFKHAFQTVRLSHLRFVYGCGRDVSACEFAWGMFWLECCPYDRTVSCKHEYYLVAFSTRIDHYIVHQSNQVKYLILEINLLDNGGYSNKYNISTTNRIYL